MTATHLTVTDFSSLGGELSDDKLRYSFPRLTYNNVAGKAQSWQIHVSLVNNADQKQPIIPAYFLPKNPMVGLVGRIDVESTTTRGNIREADPTYVRSGKNIGKNNETNVFCQALRDAIGKHNAKMRMIGHTNTTPGTKPRFYPMLAKVFSTFSPGWVSPKLDGLRAVVTWSDQCVFYSRTLANFPPINAICDEVSAALKAHPEIYLDGELYCHGQPLQKIASAVKKQESQPEIASQLVYNVYDCMIIRNSKVSDHKFSERLAMLRGLFREFDMGRRVQLVPQTFVADKAELDRIYETHLNEGYEGSILRIDSPYDSQANNYHSSQMLKIKPRFDAEFEVVGWELAEIGKAAGALMMQFKTPNGIEFWATPALPIDERIELGKKMPSEFTKKWKGKKITVYFAGYSVDGVPLQPTTKLQGRFD